MWNSIEIVVKCYEVSLCETRRLAFGEGEGEGEGEVKCLNIKIYY